MLACDGGVECPKKHECLRYRAFDNKKNQALVSAHICVSDTFKIDNHIYPKERFSELIKQGST